MNLDKVKNTIQKLLDLADSSQYENEIENAVKFARKLMIQHGIEEGELKEDNETIEHDLSEFGQDHVDTMYKNIKRWEVDLGFAVCDVVGFIKFYLDHQHTIKRNQVGIAEKDEKGKIKECKRLVFYGPKDCVKLAQSIYQDLTLTVISMSQLKYGSLYWGSGASYAEGFATGIREASRKADKEMLAEEKRLIEANKQRGKPVSECKELMVVQKSQALMKTVRHKAENWLNEEMNIELQHGRSNYRGSNIDREAYSEGKEDGKRININTSSTNKKKITGSPKFFPAN